MFAAVKPSIAPRLLAAGSEPLSLEAASRLRTEQFSTILHQTPNMMAANACNALVLLAAFWSTPQQAQALVWALSVIALSGLIYFRYTGHIPRKRTGARRLPAVAKLLLHTLALSLCWAALPVMFFREAEPGIQLLIMCLTAGMLSGGAFALASLPVAAFTFTVPIFLGAGAALIWSKGPDYLLISLVLVVYTLVLLRGVFTYAEQIKSRVLQQIETEREMRTDAMTSLPNRLWFHESVDTEFSRLSLGNEYFALIYVDLDDFKLVNDRLGHAAGDELLVEVAKRMKTAVRPSDLVARLGGDEFAVVATSIKDADDAIAIAKRLTQCFETPFSIGSEGVYCGASLGVALAPRDGDNPHSLLRNADTALYRAKQNGGLYCVLEPRHETVAREERALERDLRRALQNNQFTLVFQPLLQFGANEIKGCEALVRWVHPTRGQVPPSIFIPIAERTGFIHDLGLWILEEACRAAAQFPEGIRVAVNVSAVQLREPRFAERALSALSKAGLSRIGVEITETALLSDDQATDSSLRKLASAGIEISLDDFGTGYSSLSYLRKLPLHKIKIDRSFVTDVLKQSDCEAITRGVIRMAADLGISCVGEGVEHIEQLEWLRRNGCYEAQGYLISKPLSPPDFANFLASWNPQRFVA